VVSSPTATEETGDMGREIESLQVFDPDDFVKKSFKILLNPFYEN
jgi:hypothetical protein